MVPSWLRLQGATSPVAAEAMCWLSKAEQGHETSCNPFKIRIYAPASLLPLPPSLGMVMVCTPPPLWSVWIGVNAG